MWIFFLYNCSCCFVAGAVYKILSDPDRRALYDESGEIDDESEASLQQDTDWDSYWRLQFKVDSSSEIDIKIFSTR